MNTRRVSKKIKKADLISLNKLFEEENNILKQEVSVLNTLIKSQEERHSADLKSIIEENNSLKHNNLELINNTIQLQDTLKKIRAELAAIHTQSGNYKDKYVLHCSRVQETSRVYNDLENIIPYEIQNTSKSSRAATKQKISPIRSGLIKDSKKISQLVNKIKKLKQT
jgi:hypothetical protein